MLRKNVANQRVFFGLVNATNGSALTGATVTARRALDSSAQANASGTVTELGNGQYRFNPSQADTNGDYVGYLFRATNAVPVSANFITTGGNFADADAFGLSRLDATVSSRLAAASAPANFGDLAIAASTGRVTVGTNADKAGYSIAGGKTTLDDLNDISVANLLAGIIEGTLTLQHVLRVLLAAEAGKSNGAGGATFNLRDQADSKNRISAELDGAGNRTSVTLDAS